MDDERDVELTGTDEQAAAEEEDSISSTEEGLENGSEAEKQPEDPQAMAGEDDTASLPESAAAIMDGPSPGTVPSPIPQALGPREVEVDHDALAERRKLEDELWRSSSEAKEGAMGPFFILFGVMVAVVGLLLWLALNFLGSLELPTLEDFGLGRTDEVVVRDGPSPRDDRSTTGPTPMEPARPDEPAAPWAQPDLIDAPSRYLDGGDALPPGVGESPGGERTGPPEIPDEPDAPEDPGAQDAPGTTPPVSDQATETPPDTPVPPETTSFEWESFGLMARDLAAGTGDTALAQEFEIILTQALRMLSGLYKSGSPSAEGHFLSLDQALWENNAPVMDMSLIAKSTSTPEIITLENGDDVLVLRGVVENKGQFEVHGVLVRGRLADEGNVEHAFTYALAGKDIPSTGLRSMTAGETMSHLLDPLGIRSIPPGGSASFFLYFPGMPEGATSYRVTPVAMFPLAAASSP